MTMHHAFDWPTPENDGEVATLRHIREHGCSIINIPPGRTANEPPFSFSVGLFANYDHPELVLFGMNADPAAAIINEVREHVAKGRKFSDGEVSDEILANDYQVCFWNVPVMVYPEYLGTALWFYRKCSVVFPCLQVVWQDVNRHFPWEEKCDADVKKDQPLLRNRVS